MVGILNVAVEHRTVGLQSEVVGLAMYIQPLCRVGFVFADLIANFGMEYLGSASGHAAKAGVDQFLEDYAHWLLGLMLEPINLDSRPGLQMQIGIRIV